MSDQSAGIREEGTRLLQAGDYAGAIGKLQQALSIDERDGKAFGLLGICQARTGDMAAALQSLNNAVTLQPTDAAARYNFANALFQANRIDEARSQAEQTISLNPAHENARQLLARINEASRPAPPEPSIGGMSNQGLAGGTTPSQTEPPAPWTTSPPMQGTPAIPAPWAPAPPLQQSSTPASSGQGGLHFNPATAAVRHVAPGAGLRIARGLGWGFVYGQWWTLLTVIWALVWSGGKVSGAALIYVVLQWVFMYGFGGGLCGLIIAAVNASIPVGAIVGVVCGLALCGIEMLQQGSAGGLINVFFYFFTGRFIGSSIAARVQRPIAQ